VGGVEDEFALDDDEVDDSQIGGTVSMPRVKAVTVVDNSTSQTSGLIGGKHVVDNLHLLNMCIATARHEIITCSCSDGQSGQICCAKMFAIRHVGGEKGLCDLMGVPIKDSEIQQLNVNRPQLSAKPVPLRRAPAQTKVVDEKASFTKDVSELKLKQILSV
jgi:hypothetical protein